MAIPAHKTEYFIIENSNLQKKANTAAKGHVRIVYSFASALVTPLAHYQPFA